MCVFLFFKQKTAYEMRISDWSSDVCSSDLALGDGEIEALVAGIADGSLGEGQVGAFAMAAFLCGMNAQETVALTRAMTASGRRLDWRPFDLTGPRSEERRVGKGCVSKCRSRLSPSH